MHLLSAVRHLPSLVRRHNPSECQAARPPHSSVWWVSWKLPHAPVPARALIPGALLMAIGADVLHLLTTYWIGHLVARKTHTYGSVGIALAVLLWVYILGRIIVASGGLNAALWYRRQNR